MRTPDDNWNQPRSGGQSSARRLSNSLCGTFRDARPADVPDSDGNCSQSIMKSKHAGCRIRFIQCFTALALLALAVSCKTSSAPGQPGAGAKPVWSPDNGDGTFRNPVIFADYSDPDVIRVGDDFYLTASSFNCVPGLPILHSKDLVNWTILGHVFRRFNYGNFDVPQHGNGVWAPSLRQHNGEFYVYYGDPDFGIFMAKTRNPAGPWEPLVRVREAKGWIVNGSVLMID